METCHSLIKKESETVVIAAAFFMNHKKEKRNAKKNKPIQNKKIFNLAKAKIKSHRNCARFAGIKIWNKKIGYSGFQKKCKNGEYMLSICDQKQCQTLGSIFGLYGTIYTKYPNHY